MRGALCAVRRVGAVSISLALLARPGVSGEASIAIGGIVGATSDYVYRGVSLRDEKPTPFAYFSAKYGIAYLDAYLIGTELGEDALERSLGNIEADFTLGVKPSIGSVEFNLGTRYTVYPNGRDGVVGTLLQAERDFIEPFAGAVVALTEKFSLGGTVYWTPDYYNETGSVVTVEAQAAYVLPPFGACTSKITTFLGVVASDESFVVSPGQGYTYFNVGVEAQIERIIFDLRYWTTDVDGYGLFDQRLVLAAGVSF